MSDKDKEAKKYYISDIGNILKVSKADIVDLVRKGMIKYSIEEETEYLLIDESELQKIKDAIELKVSD